MLTATALALACLALAVLFTVAAIADAANEAATMRQDRARHAFARVRSLPSSSDSKKG